MSIEPYQALCPVQYHHWVLTYYHFIAKNGTFATTGVNNTVSFFMNRPMRCYTKKKIHTNYVTLQKFREARWPPVCWTPDGTVWVLLTLFSTQTLLPPESKQRLLKSMQFGQDPLAIAPLCSTLERLWHAAFYHKKTMFPLT